MAAVNEAVLITYMRKKLKHIALKEVHYQLVNTCLIISSAGWRYCIVGDIMDVEPNLHT